MNLEQTYKQIINHKMQIIFVLISGLLLLNSCEKKVKWKLKNSQEQFLIVNGIITNEFKNQTINLSLSYSDLNGSATYVSGANVSVSNGNTVFRFVEDSETEGIYVSENKFSGVINNTYTLSISYKNKDYSAQAIMLPVALSQPLPYKQMPDTNMFYIATDVAEFSPNVSSMYEVNLDWSEVTGYEDLPTSETSAKMYFYKLTTVDVNQIFSQNSKRVLFPYGTKMTQIKYSLSPQHEEFVRSLLIETQWHGSFFDIEEGNVYTNIDGDAFGFFGASSVVSYSSVVN